jgi:hypothetical protein
VTGRVPSDFSVLAVLAGLHYHMGVMSANSVDDALVRRAIFSGRQDSFLGSVRIRERFDFVQNALLTVPKRSFRTTVLDYNKKSHSLCKLLAELLE